MKMGTHQTGGIRFLSGEDMQKIHEQALVILQKTGIEIDDDAALQMLADAGANADLQKKIARFPADLVEHSLTTLPREITLAGRNPQRDLVLRPDGKMHTRNTGGMARIQDLKTGAVRDALLDDVADFTR
jgi:trimethylamine--corrinoid protein Co-methyltransferase